MNESVLLCILLPTKEMFKTSGRTDGTLYKIKNVHIAIYKYIAEGLHAINGRNEKNTQRVLNII